jgi:hypothetical protein
VLSRFVRSSAARTPVRFVTVTALVVLAACAGSSLTGPDGAGLVLSPDGRTLHSSGLEQRLTARIEAPPQGSPYTAQLVVTSTIVNTGGTAVALTARECLFQDADVETTADMARFEPLISCAAMSSTRNLAPGASSNTMEVQFGVRSGSGSYTLKLRHTLSPEFRGEVSFRVP